MPRNNRLFGTAVLDQLDAPQRAEAAGVAHDWVAPSEVSKAVLDPALNLEGTLEQPFFYIDPGRSQPGGDGEHMARVRVAHIEQRAIEVFGDRLSHQHAA